MTHEVHGQQGYGGGTAAAHSPSAGPAVASGFWPGRGFPGGTGGLLDARTPGAELVSLLRREAGSYTDEPVLAIGGFNGSDPAPTLAGFQQLVAQGMVHYFIAGGGRMMGGSSGTSSQISSWVEESFTARTVGGARSTT